MRGDNRCPLKYPEHKTLTMNISSKQRAFGKMPEVFFAALEKHFDKGKTKDTGSVVPDVRPKYGLRSNTSGSKIFKKSQVNDFVYAGLALVCF